MKHPITYSLLLQLLCAGLGLQAQEGRYRYSMDLQLACNDELQVKYTTP